MIKKIILFFLLIFSASIIFIFYLNNKKTENTSSVFPQRKIMNLASRKDDFRSIEKDTSKEKIAFIQREKEEDKKKDFIEEKKLSYIAIIVDDLGDGTKGTEEILNLDYPLTLAIIPNLKYSKEIAEQAHNKNFQIIVHLPLETENEKYNKKIPPIRVNMTDEEIKKMTEHSFESIPYAVGFNNHQGGKATSDPTLMRKILEIAKEKDFFYIDSLTTPHSVGSFVAKELGVENAKRDVFLDNVKSEKYIKRQFKTLVKIAKRRGKAIGICHVNSTTARVLKEVLPTLEKQDIKLVFAKDIAE